MTKMTWRSTVSHHSPLWESMSRSLYYIIFGVALVIWALWLQSAFFYMTSPADCLWQPFLKQQPLSIHCSVLACRHSTEQEWSAAPWRTYSWLAAVGLDISSMAIRECSRSCCLLVSDFPASNHCSASKPCSFSCLCRSWLLTTVAWRWLTFRNEVFIHCGNSDSILVWEWASFSAMITLLCLLFNSSSSLSCPLLIISIKDKWTSLSFDSSLPLPCTSSDSICFPNDAAVSFLSSLAPSPALCGRLWW